MISQHWFKGAIRQQTITWTNVDPDLYHHVATLGHNELNLIDILQSFLTQYFIEWWDCVESVNGFMPFKQ